MQENEEIRDILDAPVETQVEDTQVDAVEQTTEEVSEESGFKAKFEGFEDKVTETTSEDNKVQEETTTEQVVDTQEPELTVDRVEESKTPVVSETTSVKEESKLPEQVEKLMKFMDETGGTIEDYNILNTDYTKLDEDELIKSHLKSENPDFTDEEINWEFEDKFGVDEDADEDSREYKKAVLNKKRALTAASGHFEEYKEKYLVDLKSGEPKDIPEDYKEAYKQVGVQREQAEKNEQWNTSFKDETSKIFSEDFKGFVFDTGEAKFRVKESNFSNTKDIQSDFNALSKEHLDSEGNVANMVEYQKAVYAARNADKIAKHFYQQGKADALTERAKTTKNIDMKPRTTDPSAGVNEGIKVKFLNPKG